MFFGDHKINTKTELLAPAGSKESFYAALNAGADAIYLAASKFGARAYAGNFTYEEILECAETAHLYDKKIYLTVNTLVKEKEFDELEEFCESGIPDASDGLIIQDLGVASFFRNRKPDIPLHASTQMSVTGPLGTALLKDNGFTRVVPARELTFEEIRNIYEKTGIEIECFIHGAMCYSYSGQCLFSSVLGGRSGNRGRCAQPCRLPYRISGTDSHEETYPLSLKDMCTIEILPQILNAGVCSLKVEGRMKPPEYVDGVISIYRKYLDLIMSGNEYHVEKKDLRTLSELYVRGSLSHGYYDRRNSREMVTITSHGYNGSSDDENKNENQKNRYGSVNELFDVSFDAVFRTGQNAYITASAVTKYGDTVYGYAEGEEVMPALKAAVDRDNVIKALKKLGNTVFRTDDEHISIDIDDNAFYSLKGLNQLRRNALEDLKKNIISSYDTREGHSYNDSNSTDSSLCEIHEHHNDDIYQSNRNAGKLYSILINSAEQAEAVINAIESGKFSSVCRIYLDESLMIDRLDSGNIIDELNKTLPEDISIYEALSFIRRKGDDIGFIGNLLESGRIKGLLVRNLEDLAYFTRDYGDRIITDFNLYSYNMTAASFLDKYSAGHTIPLELSKQESDDVLKGKAEFERVIYGRAPLMITANCVHKTLKSCSHAGGFETIIDRKGVSFPVKCDCHHCLNVIYNSVPLLLEKDRRDDVTCRIEFSNENSKEVTEVLEVYTGSHDPHDIKHTGGWFNRPVM
jgi:putative protease